MGGGSGTGGVQFTYLNGRWYKYHHIGTGHTEPTYYCIVCDGYYGVPHDGDTHKHAQQGKFSRYCACRACQEHYGVYPREGEYRWVERKRPLRAETTATRTRRRRTR